MDGRKYFSSEVSLFSEKLYLTCDGKCNKAFGKIERPSSPNSLNEDDFEWLADDEVGEAPGVSGYVVDGENKPTQIPELHNRWCIGMCERSILIKLGQNAILPNFDKRVPNSKYRE